MDISNIYNPVQSRSPYPALQPTSNFMPQFQQKMEVIRVNGRNGAESLNLAPYSSALLLDINDPLVWFVSTDGAGYKTCVPYLITPYQPEQKASIEDLITKINARLDSLEERMNIKHESNNATTKPVERTEWNI